MMLKFFPLLLLALSVLALLVLGLAEPIKIPARVVVPEEPIHVDSI